MKPLTTAWNRPGNKFLSSPPESVSPALAGSAHSISIKPAHASVRMKIILPFCPVLSVDVLDEHIRDRPIGRLADDRF